MNENLSERSWIGTVVIPYRQGTAELQQFLKSYRIKAFDKTFNTVKRSS